MDTLNDRRLDPRKLPSCTADKSLELVRVRVLDSKLAQALVLDLEDLSKAVAGKALKHRVVDEKALRELEMASIEAKAKDNSYHHHHHLLLAVTSYHHHLVEAHQLEDQRDTLVARQSHHLHTAQTELEDIEIDLKPFPRCKLISI